MFLLGSNFGLIHTSLHLAIHTCNKISPPYVSHNKYKSGFHARNGQFKSILNPHFIEELKFAQFEELDPIYFKMLRETMGDEAELGDNSTGITSQWSFLITPESKVHFLQDDKSYDLWHHCLGHCSKNMLWHANVKLKDIPSLTPVMISSFSFLYFFTSLTVWAPPNSYLLTTYIPWPSTIFFYLLIHCSTTFPHILSLVLLTSSTTFFFLLYYSLDYIMDSRPRYINPQSSPYIP